MAKKKNRASETGTFVVVKNERGDIYVAQIGRPVTASLSESQKRELGEAFDAYRKVAGRSYNANAVLVDGDTGVWRILQQGGNRNVDSGQTDPNNDPNKKKKK
ncbi:MAG TPA: hypothetical protein VGG10_02260 [Rhizomicrobium sp.]|jgi:hypothetical protein